MGDPRHPAAAYLFGCAFGLKEFSTNGTAEMPASLVDIGKEEEKLLYEIKGGDMFVSKTQVEDDEPDPIVGAHGNIECLDFLILLFDGEMADIV